MSGKYKRKDYSLNKLSAFWGQHKIAFGLFAFTVMYNFVIINSFGPCEVNSTTYSFYLVDYSLGFCTKLLPGALYNAIFPTTDPNSVNLYLNCLYHAFLLGLSFVLEKFIKAFDAKDTKTATVIAVLFLTGPSTLAFHTKYLGMFDTYWLFFLLGFILFIRNKYLKWIVPVFFVLSVLIHFASAIIVIPLFSLLLLYEAARSKENKKEYYVILAISLLVSAISLGYFVLFEQSNLTLTLEQFHEFMDERNLPGYDEPAFYFDYALYKYSYIEQDLFSKQILLEGDGFFANVINTVWSQIYMTYSTYGDISTIGISLRLFAISFIASLPVLILNYKYIISHMKKHSDNKILKLVSICLLIYVPVSFLCLMLFSPDLDRWFGLIFTAFFVATMYFMYKSKEDLTKWLPSLKTKQSKVIFTIYFALYAVVAPVLMYAL